MNLTIDRTTKNFVIVRGEDLELYYYEAYEQGSGALKRSFGEVNGYKFSTFESLTGKPYWKKNGRGRMKNQKEVEAKLVEADSFLVNEHDCYFYKR
ncbi:hypothetical protein P9X10_01250 [Bacillus cereus]|nr:hypothetical protein [Bacillus cereus]